MSWIRILIHIVFTTKNSYPFLNLLEIRKQVFNHIIKNAKEKNLWILCVGGYSDHAHCLISLNKDNTLSRTVQLIKGESSHWINQNNLVPNKFEGQDDYWAVSISESHLERVKQYIWNQEEHHRIKTFQEEIEEFMRKYGWKYIMER